MGSGSYIYFDTHIHSISHFFVAVSRLYSWPTCLIKTIRRLYSGTHNKRTLTMQGVQTQISIIGNEEMMRVVRLAHNTYRGGTRKQGNVNTS